MGAKRKSEPSKDVGGERDEKSPEVTTTDAAKTEERQLFLPGLVSTIYYLFIFVCLGIPIWLKTTTPVRYSLPDISALMVHSQMMTHRIAVTIIAVDNAIDDDRRTELRQQLSSGWTRGRSADGAYAFEYKWKVRPALEEELAIFRERRGLIEIDGALSNLASNQVEKKIWIFLIDGELLESRAVALGTSRFIYIRSSDESLAETIIDTIGQVLEPSRPSDETSLLTAAAPQEQTARKQLLLDPEIDVFVNLIVEDINDAEHVRSEVLSAIHTVTDHGFLAQSGINELLKVEVTSQMVYYAFDSKILTRSDDKTRQLNLADIPLLLNGIESRVAEPNNKQSFNLNVLIPSRAESGPVVFADQQGKQSTAILSSHNAGILVLNDVNDFNIAFKCFMRSLLALPISLPKNSVRQNVFFAKWELDAVMRSVSQNQILKTLASLESIEKLLGKVSREIRS